MDVQTVTVMIAGISVVIGVINSILSNRRADEQRQIAVKTQELALQAQQQALETRQAELFMQIYNRWNTTATAEQYLMVRYVYSFTDLKGWQAQVGVDENTLRISDYDATRAHIYSDVQSMANFFEGIGVLVNRKLIDIDLVEELLADRVIWWWEYFRCISEESRRQLGDMKLHDHTEYLYNAMKHRQQAIVTPG